MVPVPGGSSVPVGSASSWAGGVEGGGVVAEAGGGGGDVDDLARAGAEVGGEEGAGKGDAGAQEHIGVGPLRVVWDCGWASSRFTAGLFPTWSPVPHTFQVGELPGTNGQTTFRKVVPGTTGTIDFIADFLVPGNRLKIGSLNQASANRAPRRIGGDDGSDEVYS